MKRVWITIALSVALVLPSSAAGKKPKSGKTGSEPRTGKVRVFVGESESFYASSFGAASATPRNATAVQSSSAGIEKMTVLVMKDLYDNCPMVTVVNRPDLADYFLRLDRNGVLVRTNAMAVFNKAGEMIFVGSGVRLTKQVKKFCAGIPVVAAAGNASR